MGFRNFRVNIIVRILILVVAITGVALFIADAEYIRVIYLGIMIIGLAVEFFYYSDKLNRDLEQFLSSIIYDDFTPRFKNRGKGKSFKQLYGTLNLITLKFKSLSKEKETRSQYFFSLINQVKVGIISFDGEGSVNLVNKAFNEMMDTHGVRIGTNLREQEPELFSMLEMVSLGDRQLLRRKVGNVEKEFSFVSSGFKMESSFYNLVSVQDIREELDRREHEAWQKLIRVLTHEIMNSVTPIASLTGSLHDLVNEANTQMEEKMLREKLAVGLEAIQERSTGLLKFTEAYQNLARTPAPVFTEIHTKALVKRIGVLFDADFESAGIEFSVSTEEAPETFQADIDLFEQVIINLVRNAADAVENSENKKISLNIQSSANGKLSVSVTDTGRGIPDIQVDRIFVPFYSTKENGSGIGLSLSRQIILMHRGTISVNSREGKGSTFEIIL